MVSGTGGDKKEFDNYAERYKDALNHPLRNIASSGDEAFLKIKVEWLFEHLRRHPLAQIRLPADINLLDYGCGTGGFINILRQMHFPGKISGCDISGGMLRQAEKLVSLDWLVNLHQIHGHDTGFADETFDIIVAVCVFHHIPPEEREHVLGELYRILKPRGRFYLFEHNPYNPLTQLIVSQTPMDRNAILLSRNYTIKLVKTMGLKPLQADYFLFFPPRLSFLRKIEDILPWLPLGGQFVVVAEKQ